MKLRQITIPQNIKTLLSQGTPPSLIKEREAGKGKTLSYIAGATVIDMLNNAFGHMWNWTVEEQWLEAGIPWFNKYAKPEPVYEEQGPICHVRGVLEVMMENEDGKIITVKRSGLGSKAVIGKQSEQDSIFKAASTDALKKAASTFGIGLDLYRSEDEQEYFDYLNYVDPWTEEMITKYKDQRDFIGKIIEEYELDEEGQAEIMATFSNGVLTSFDDIVPENIEAFVAYINAEVNK